MFKAIFAMFVAFSILTAPAARGTVLLAVDPPSRTIALGSSLSIAVDIAGLGNGTALGAFDINVNFDSALLAFKGATFGDPALGDQLDLSRLAINAPLAAPGTGTVELIETSFDPPSLLLTSQASSFTLATLSFAATAAGSSPITLTLNGLSDAAGLPLLATGGNGSVTIAVPEPRTWLLTIIGLSLVLGFAGRSRSLPAPVSGPVLKH